MERSIEVHFFHGFLGLPSDWQFFEKLLSRDLSYQSRLHNLWEEVSQLPLISFKTWSTYQEEKLGAKENLRIAVGYSLGGRLLMNVDPSLFDQMILIASHPGLEDDELKSERLQRDTLWADKICHQSWDQFLKDWNQQEVFLKDKKRPLRIRESYDQNSLRQTLVGFSLGRQGIMDAHLSKYKNKFHWMCGEEDSKFMNLKPRFDRILGKDRVTVISQSGHGCLFDNPDLLAVAVNNVIQKVL